MSPSKYPAFFADRVFPADEAIRACVRSGMTIATGFATSEPHSFYAGLWDHIRREDLRDLNFRQALFMAPHRLCVGDALSGRGLLPGVAEKVGSFSLFAGLARQANAITRKVEGLRALLEHYDELRERRITLTSAFLGPATNMIVPANPITSLLSADYVGRNTTRMGITDMQSIHFPDAVDSMGYDPDGRALIDAFVLVMTPPNAKGEMSHGPANGANGEILDKILAARDVSVLLYVNPGYPFTRGYGDAPNTVHVTDFEGLARAGRLYVVEDEGKLPALPAGSLANPSPVELAIAEHVVNHIELTKHVTYGRAIQVGFGGTGVLAIRALKDSGWHGRGYTEMLEPFTLDLFDAGKIAGSHFIELDGRRTMLDGKMVCTFTIAEEGSDFYARIADNPAIVIAPASRVVIPEGFYHGLGINNCLGVDFHGHVNSGGRDRNHHSGIGGGAQIFRGLARGGVGYLCMKSTHKTPDGRLRSSIFPFMPQGTPISHVGPDLMGGREGARFYLVTEHGVARVSGLPQSAFIRALVSVADPQFRDWLKREAWEEFRVRV
jgi:acyl-CoA hydrolase